MESSHGERYAMNILLVDDNPDYRSLLKEVLFASGYKVFLADDGLQGTEILGKEKIDLVISDIRMPRFDGLKLHSFARQMPEYENIGFIFISGYKDVYDNALQLDPSKDFFFDKLTPLEKIVECVDKLVFGKFAELWHNN